MLRTIVVAVIALTGLPVLAARASETAAVPEMPIAFDLPAQELSDSLLAVGRQGRRSILFAPEVVAGYAAAPLKGRYTLTQALGRLLSGTGLVYRMTRGASIMILRPANKGAAAITPAESPPPAVGQSIEEVIVSAQKREEPLQDVPISVTALRGADIESRGAEGLTDYTRLVPGLAYIDFGPSGDRNVRTLIIRGIDAPNEQFAAPSLGFYIDETPISVVDPKLFDIDRIEVLRGPQGTLYGVGTAGGTIKVVTNQPRLDRFEGLLEGSALSVAHGQSGARLNGMINAPLGANAALRISGYYRDEPGYIDSVVAPSTERGFLVENSRAVAAKDFNDQKVQGARAAMLFRVGERLSITPSIFVQKSELGGQPVHAPQVTGDLQVVRQTTTPESDIFRLYSLTARLDVGFADLVSVTSRYTSDFHGQEDITDLVRDVFEFGVPPEVSFVLQDPAPFFVDDEDQRTTQELRLASRASGRLQWLLGAFYQSREARRFQGLTLAGVDQLTPIDIPGDVLAAFDARLDLEEYAAFGEITYDLTPRWHLTGGFRYYNIDQTVTTLTDGFFFGGGDLQLQESSEDGVRPKLQLSFDASDDVMVFATASQGFRLGGTAPTVPDTAACRAGLEQLGVPFPAPESYEADSIWNYELGAKSTWLDRRVVFNASLYYVSRSDIVQTTPIPGDCGFNVTLNAGKASSRGAEMELNALLIEGLTVDVALGYTDAQLDANDPGNPEARAGDRLLGIPEWTASTAAQYRFPLLRDAEGSVRIDFQYIADRTTDFLEGTVNHELPGYGTLNLRLGVERKPWAATLFLDNALDRRPRLSLRAFGHDFNTFNTLAPRTLGLTVRHYF